MATRASRDDLRRQRDAASSPLGAAVLECQIPREDAIQAADAG